jgi:putative phosphotransacetylase
MWYYNGWDTAQIDPFLSRRPTYQNYNAWKVVEFMDKLKVIIEGSARHVHVSKEDLERLFGEGAQLHNKRELSQPNQYLTEERVRIEGPRGCIDRVSILGPERNQTQVEVSFTDARTLGLTPPVRESGDLKGSDPIRITGPAGSIDLEEGCIVAKRHIHITPQDAEKYGLEDREVVQVRVEGERALTFDEVVVRVSDKFQTRMHIDFDEMNAAQICPNQEGTVIKKV